MSTFQIPNQQLRSPFNWSSLIQLILSSFTVLFLLGAAVLVALTSVAQYFGQGSGNLDPTQPLMVAASLALGGVLVVPSAWYAWKRLAFPAWKPVPKPERRGFVLIFSLMVLILVVGSLLLGNWISLNSHLTWLFLPPLNLIASGLPALWFVYIGTRGLITDSPERRWGVFASGLVLGPLVILILELLVLIGMVILSLLWAVFNPSFATQLNDLVIRIQVAAPNPDAILRILLPFVLQPGILFVGFAFISLIVPLIEEALKPIGVWMLAGQKLTQAHGFAYGVLSGAGFGLFENLGNTSGAGEAWALLASARISTLLLHSLTAGLVGWALASAWSQKRYLRLGVTYAFAVLVHGLWNGMAVLSSVTSLEGLTNISIPTVLVQIGNYSTFGIVALGVFVLVLYISVNAILQNSLKHQSLESTPEGGVPALPARETFPPGSDESFNPDASMSVLPASPTSVTPPILPKKPQVPPIEGYPPTNPDSNP